MTTCIEKGRAFLSGYYTIGRSDVHLLLDSVFVFRSWALVLINSFAILRLSHRFGYPCSESGDTAPVLCNCVNLFQCRWDWFVKHSTSCTRGFDIVIATMSFNLTLRVYLLQRNERYVGRICVIICTSGAWAQAVLYMMNTANARASQWSHLW